MKLINNSNSNRFLEVLDNKSNYYIINGKNKISFNDEQAIRSWHNLDKNEELSIIYHQSIFEKGNIFSADKTYHFSTCITNNFISFAAIIDSKGWSKSQNALIRVYWDEIEKVTYTNNVNLEHIRNLSNTFFINNDPSININPNVNILSLYSSNDHSCLIIPNFYISDTELISEFLNNLLFAEKSRNSEYQNKKFDVSLSLNSFVENGNYKELLQFIDDNSDYISTAKQNYLKTIAYTKLGDLNKAENNYYQLKSIQIKATIKDENYDKINRYYFLSRAELKKAKGEDYESALSYNKVLELEQNKNDVDYTFVKSLKSKSKESYNNYVTNFLDYQYNDRKVITLSNNTLFKGELTSVLDINNLPNIKFPIAQPQDGETYICHPHNHTIYLPIENYEKELLDDRINEFCYLLQCLGATSITIDNTNKETTNIQETEIKDKKLNFEITKKFIDKIPQTAILGKFSDKNLGLGDGSGTAHKSGSTTNSLNHSTLAKSQTFNPTKKPYIPNSLTWFNQELSWQRLAQQRLDGNLLFHKEDISSTQNKVVNHTEYNKLKADLNLLVASAGIDKKNLQLFNSTLDINETWNIQVTFKPLEEFEDTQLSDYFPNDKIQLENSQPNNSENDKYYLEELISLLNENQEITKSDEIFLNRFRKIYNISPEKDIELRKIAFESIKPKFTDDELEYIQDLENIVGSAEEIDEKTRKTLTKLSMLLNIDEERALEIESFYFKSKK